MSSVGACRVAAFLIVLWSLTAGIVAGPPQVQEPLPKIKRVDVTPIASTGGEENYFAYCAVCHGTVGKGDGPAAPAMKVPVPDLTTYAKRHAGKFDALQVRDIIRGTGRLSTAAHGSPDMPIWGAVFQSEDKARQTLRIGNLVKYLESIQEGTGAGPK